MMVNKNIVWYNVSACGSLFALIKGVSEYEAK